MGFENMPPFIQHKQTECDVIIIGGGVVGSAVAQFLAPDNDVVVLEKNEIASRASGLAGGVVSPTKFLSEYPSAARYANDFFEEFDGTGDFRFTRRSRIGVMTTEQVESMRTRASTLAEQGFPVSFYDGKELEKLHSMLDMSNFSGAIEYRDAGWIDPYIYTQTLKNEAEEAGAEFRTGVQVTDLVCSNDRVHGVETQNYTIEASTVVCAMGWQTRDFLNGYLSLPLQPWRLNACVLQMNEPLPNDFPIVHVERGFTSRPRHNGNLRVGNVGGGIARNPEELATGGAAAESFLNTVTEDVSKLIPAGADAEIAHHYAGVAGITPDVRPVIDSPDTGPSGLVVALGTGVGVTCSPILGQGVRSMITDEACPFDLEPFSLSRLSEYDSTFSVEDLPDYWRPG